MSPGGRVELCTSGPGFTLDEKLEDLGDRLCLSPRVEPLRAKLEAELPPIVNPRPRSKSAGDWSARRSPPLMLLPTTMVGAYPRPAWFRDQLEGRDILEAFKVIQREEAFHDAVGAVIDDQEAAGLDIVTDGQMWFDDYAMGIGSFLWYWLERIGGFGREKLPHPARSRTGGKDVWILDEAGGVAVRGPIERGPVRLAELYAIAARAADRPVKACVGAGPVQLSTLAHFEAGPINNRYELSAALADVFRAEIDDLVAAGCRHVQLEDLGAWMPNVTGAERDFDWVRDTVNRLFAGVEGVERCWHFCLGNAWGARRGADDGRLRRDPAALLRRRRRRVRARLRLPRDGRRRGAARPAARQGDPRRRHRRAHPRDRAARAGRRAHPRGARASSPPSG